MLNTFSTVSGSEVGRGTVQLPEKLSYSVQPNTKYMENKTAQIAPKKNGVAAEWQTPDSPNDVIVGKVDKEWGVAYRRRELHFDPHESNNNNN